MDFNSSASAAGFGTSTPPGATPPPTHSKTLSTSVPTGPDPHKLKWFSEFRPHFDDWVIGPIDRLVSSEDALIGFIIMACTIDYLAGFWCGQQTTPKEYLNFIKAYVPPNRYNPIDLRDCLRNGLVHNFTIKHKKYALTHNNQIAHRQVDHNGQIVLNALDFRNDLVAAKDRYFDDVQAQPRLLDLAYKRYTNIGFLEPVPFHTIPSPSL